MSDKPGSADVVAPSSGPRFPATAATAETIGSLLYEQPQSQYRSRQIVPIVLVGVALIGLVGALVAGVRWLLDTPNLPLSYWMLPVILILLFPLFLLLTGSDLGRRRFAVYQNGFRSPYTRAFLSARPVDLFIPFRAIARFTATTYSYRGRQGIYNFSIALRNGGGFDLPTSDIGEAGAAALLSAWLASHPKAAPGKVPPPPWQGAPPWTQRESQFTSYGLWLLIIVLSLGFAMDLLSPITNVLTTVLFAVLCLTGMATGFVLLSTEKKRRVG